MRKQKMKRKKREKNMKRTLGTLSAQARNGPMAQEAPPEVVSSLPLFRPLTGGTHLSASPSSSRRQSRARSPRASFPPWLNPVDSGSKSLPRLRLFNPRTLLYDSPHLILAKRRQAVGSQLQEISLEKILGTPSIRGSRHPLDPLNPSRPSRLVQTHPLTFFLVCRSVGATRRAHRRNTEAAPLQPPLLVTPRRERARRPHPRALRGAPHLFDHLPIARDR
jgi:hypothetical protein